MPKTDCELLKSKSGPGKENPCSYYSFTQVCCLFYCSWFHWDCSLVYFKLQYMSTWLFDTFRLLLQQGKLSNVLQENIKCVVSIAIQNMNGFCWLFLILQSNFDIQPTVSCLMILLGLSGITFARRFSGYWISLDLDRLSLSETVSKVVRWVCGLRLNFGCWIVAVCLIL